MAALFYPTPFGVPFWQPEMYISSSSSSGSTFTGAHLTASNNSMKAATASGKMPWGAKLTGFFKKHNGAAENKATLEEELNKQDGQRRVGNILKKVISTVTAPLKHRQQHNKDEHNIGQSHSRQDKLKQKADETQHDTQLIKTTDRECDVTSSSAIKQSAEETTITEAPLIDAHDAVQQTTSGQKDKSFGYALRASSSCPALTLTPVTPPRPLSRHDIIRELAMQHAKANLNSIKSNDSGNGLGILEDMIDVDVVFAKEISVDRLDCKSTCSDNSSDDEPESSVINVNDDEEREDQNTDNDDEDEDDDDDTDDDSDATSTVSNDSSESSSTSQDTIKAAEAKKQAIWGDLLKISKAQMIELANTFMHRPGNTVEKIVIKSGQNNRVHILHYDDGYKFCVRVPACGWGKKWTNADRQQLKDTVNMMKLLAKETNMLVPKVIQYDTDMDNSIRAPYIAMQCIEGVRPIDVWYGKGATDGGMHWISTVTKEIVDNPDTHPHKCIMDYRPISEELEDKRQTMLDSLATQVAELRKFSFSLYGTPVFSEDGERIEYIGPRMTESMGVSARSDRSTSHEVIGEDAHADIKGCLLHSLAEWHEEALEELTEELDMNGNSPEERDHVFALHEGGTNFLRLVISCLPETLQSRCSRPAFVLAPPDFCSQNLLCDPHTGEITGIIDWDRTNTQPRYAGWALPPGWLNHDFWSPATTYKFGTKGRAMHAEEHERYRADYAQYLREACEADGNVYDVDDWKYTEKGPILEELLTSVKENHTPSIRRVTNHILRAVVPRIDHDEFLKELFWEGEIGAGYEDMLIQRIKKYLGLDDENGV